MTADIDVLIVTHNRNESLLHSLEELLPVPGCSLIVIVDGKDDELGARLRELASLHGNLRYKVLDVTMQKSRARNEGLAMVTADIVYFLDDDARCGQGTIERIRQAFAGDPAADVVGGPNLTPRESTAFQRLSGYLFSSLFTAWRMSRRYRADSAAGPCDDTSLVLCNLAVRSRVLKEENLRFDERLTYNEENLLLRMLKERGHRMLYSPEIVVYHDRRATAAAFARQVFGSGAGRAAMTIFHPRSFSFTYAVPALFVLYLVSLLFYGPAWYRIPAAVYAALGLVNAASIAVKNGENAVSVPVLLFLTLTAHVSYGIGFIYGLVKNLLWKN